MGSIDGTNGRSPDPKNGEAGRREHASTVGIGRRVTAKRTASPLFADGHSFDLKGSF
jgi:hypothetical protein